MKISMICNTAGALYVFRKPIIRELLSRGHTVSALSSSGLYQEELADLGVETKTVDFLGSSMSVKHNLKLISKIRNILKKERPQIVHAFTHKAAIYGTIAARLAGIRRVFVTITGLGTLFMYQNARTRLARVLLLLQYRIALPLAEKVFFQNPDDMKYFLDKGIVRRVKAVLTNGSGIDLSEYIVPTPDKIASCRLMLTEELGISIGEKTVVLFPARAIKEKGLEDFYESAKFIGSETDRFVFIHLGLPDEDVFDKERLVAYGHECGVAYLGFKEKIIDYMTASDIVVLPSYREGVPRSLIEALALDKYIITTDTPGCRETVIDGWNGSLCEVSEVNDLAGKIMAVDRELLDKCRGRSREYSEKKFDVEDLIEITMDAYFSSGDAIEQK